MSQPTNTTKRNQSIAKAFEIIEAMANVPGSVRLQDISKMLGLPASTVLRFLKTLMDNGYVNQNPNTLQYFLTHKFCRIGDRVKGQVQIQYLVHPYIKRLSHELGESTSLAVVQDMRVVYIDAIDGPDHTLQYLQRIGKNAPLNATGVGKVLLIDKSYGEIEDIINTKGLPKLTSKTIISKTKLRRELQNIRKNGFAIDDEECEVGVRCVAAPLRDHTNTVIAAISTSMPIGRLPIERTLIIGKRLAKLASEISQEMGYLPD